MTVVACLLLFVPMAGKAVARHRGVASRAAATNRKPADVTIDENQIKRAIDCKGGGVTINGDKNQLTLTGQCSTLKVNGNENIVSVEAVAEISTWGNRNNVTWRRGAGGKPPKISNPGTANNIKKAEN
jgi:hypothetical protein